MHYLIGFIFIVVLLFNIVELKKTINWAPISIGAILLLAIFVSLIPIILLLIPFFGVYRFIIKSILKIKHGKDFYELLNGADAFHMVDKSSNVIINSCLMVRCEKYTSEEFYEISREAMLKLFVLKRFHAVLCKCFGYPYIIKQESDLLKYCVSKIETLDCPEKRINKRQLYELLNYYYNVPMLKNGKVPCQILIGTQPVNWKNDNCDYYPIIVKVHHSVADGVSLLKTLVTVIADRLESKEPINFSKSFKQDEKRLSVNKQVKKLIDILGIIKTSFLIFFLYPSLVVAYFTYKAKDTNILHNTTLTHQTVIGTSTEEDAKYVGKIKRIKDKLPGTAFSTILMAAFTSSLSDYFKKNSIQPPQYITISIPVIANAAELRYLNPGDVTIDDTFLSNSYSLILARVPIEIGNNGKSEFSANNQVINRLKLINREIGIIKDSLEYQINFFFMQVVFTVLPQFFTKLMIDTMHCTSIVSILAGPPKITYYNRELVITDIISWVPHVHHIGTSLAVITYDDRLHIGVNIDKALISDQNDVQGITDDIYKYLDILEKEVEEHCNVNV